MSAEEGRYKKYPKQKEEKHMNGKILTSLLVIGIVIGLTGGATFAYFSDTETSTGNTFTAGTLNLQVGAADPTIESISISNMKPDDRGNAATWLTKNIGTLSGKLSLDIGTVTNYENVRTEPEKDATDETTGNEEGELGEYLKVAIWLDFNKNGLWDTGDKYLTDAPGVVTAEAAITDQPLPAAAYDYLNDFSGKSYTADTLAVTMGGNDEFNFRVEYELPEADNINKVQSDSSVFDITFTLTQS
ncbi:MAG: TasA family protein [Methanocellales archaeon]|nr:TasA family protein [Methanocellales archaeon]